MLVGASAVVLNGVTNVETTEALACKKDLALASDLLIQKFRLASDCASVIKNLQGAGMSSYGQVIRKINAGRGRFRSCTKAEDPTSMHMRWSGARFIVRSVDMCGF